MFKILNGKLVNKEKETEQKKEELKPVEPVQPIEPTPKIEPVYEQESAQVAYELEVALKNQEANLRFIITSDEELGITVTSIVDAIHNKACVEVQNCIINCAEVLFCTHRVAE